MKRRRSVCSLNVSCVWHADSDHLCGISPPLDTLSHSVPYPHFVILLWLLRMAMRVPRWSFVQQTACVLQTYMSGGTISVRVYVEKVQSMSTWGCNNKWYNIIDWEMALYSLETRMNTLFSNMAKTRATD